jgi:hypothetical protein
MPSESSEQPGFGRSLAVPCLSARHNPNVFSLWPHRQRRRRYDRSILSRSGSTASFTYRPVGLVPRHLRSAANGARLRGCDREGVSTVETIMEERRVSIARNAIART